MTVGGAFLALGALLFWRELPLGPAVAMTIGVGLRLGGLLVPARLGPVYGAWMRFASGISRVTSPIFLGLVYNLVFTPTGELMRLLGRNPLARTRGRSQWAARGGTTDRHGDVLHQF